MLKINSNFSDYYDCAIGSFVDSGIIINRKSSEETINALQDFPESIKKNFKYFDYSWRWHTKSTYGQDQIAAVGFCGNWYYLVKPKYDESFYVTRDQIATNNYSNSFFHYGSDVKDLNDFEYFTKDIFEKYGPALYIDDVDLHKFDSVHNYFLRNKNLKITIWPNLKELNFSKIKDPYSALWLLEHWHDTHARPDEAIVPVGDDITRLQAYGFDKKTSFRKSKGNKK